ncbi:hypothetical protein [Oceaniglobus ichthyenteri]|nr:hypothetical protein [Oceaniglobus ichthyenteri]
MQISFSCGTAAVRVVMQLGAVLRPSAPDSTAADWISAQLFGVSAR